MPISFTDTQRLILLVDNHCQQVGVSAGEVYLTGLISVSLPNFSKCGKEFYNHFALMPALLNAITLREIMFAIISFVCANAFLHSNIRYMGPVMRCFPGITPSRVRTLGLRMASFSMGACIL